MHFSAFITAGVLFCAAMAAPTTAVPGGSNFEKKSTCSIAYTGMGQTFATYADCMCVFMANPQAKRGCTGNGTSYFSDGEMAKEGEVVHLDPLCCGVWSLADLGMQ